MKLPPKEIDAVDLLYAVNSLCGWEALRDMGLNRRGYRGAKKAQKWFFGELVKAIELRKRRVQREVR